MKFLLPLMALAFMSSAVWAGDDGSVKATMPPHLPLSEAPTPGFTLLQWDHESALNLFKVLGVKEQLADHGQRNLYEYHEKTWTSPDKKQTIYCMYCVGTSSKGDALTPEATATCEITQGLLRVPPIACDVP